MGAQKGNRLWATAIVLIVSTNFISLGIASRNGPSDMAIVCTRFPSSSLCQSLKIKPSQANSANGGPLPPLSPGSGSKGPAPGPIPPPLPTPPPIGVPQPAPNAFQPQPLPAPPPVQNFQPQSFPAPQSQPSFPAPQPQPSFPAAQPSFPAPQSLPAPQPALPAPPPASAPALPSGGGLDSISKPLGFLGGSAANNMPAPGSVPNGPGTLGIGSGTQVGDFAGVGRQTAINPFSGVNSGTNINAAGLPIQSQSGVNFGGLIPGGAGLSSLFGRRRRRQANNNWYIRYVRSTLRL